MDNFDAYLQREVTNLDGLSDLPNVNWHYFELREYGLESKLHNDWQETLESLNSEKPIVFCSIQAAKYLQKHNPKIARGLIVSNEHPEPRIGMPSIFDYNQYSYIFPKEHLLNTDGVMTTLGELNKKYHKSGEIFFRPNSGWKPFTGMGSNGDELKTDIETLYRLEGAKEHEIVWAFEHLGIDEEYRFWIVDSAIATASSYSWHFDHKHYQPPQEVYDFVSDMCKYTDRAGLTECVIDVTMGEDNVCKIIEINAMSTSGWYGAMRPLDLITEILKIYE